MLAHLTGNTSSGIFHTWPDADIIINVARVKQLRAITFKTVSTLLLLLAKCRKVSLGTHALGLTHHACPKCCCPA